MLYSDGKAIDITLQHDKSKDEPYVWNGFHGFLMADGVSGDEVAMEIAQREHMINVGGVTANVGDILYLTANGTVTATSSGNTKAFKCTSTKDSQNNVTVLNLAQGL